ncbi:hypothetical protein FNF28_07623 [Cafeteria roenbergensis]|uniref:Uncharacterized protein n=1 Tax=Cafeteria roenbergensis TaxID=33653 RepID=A0A5A8C4Q3_CAFRO|nr:hypothetical protein FNF28_07623 [Cafeteria roenbergensis]
MAARKYKDSRGAGLPAAERMQGFYNLAAILLVFSVSYIVYPGNVTPLNFAYFLACPSLVYDPTFPATKRRRWKFIFRKVLEMLACSCSSTRSSPSSSSPFWLPRAPYGPLMEIAKLAMPSMGFKTARPWFALGMLAQMPLIALSKRFKGSRRGNFVVWFSLFLGQPLIEILYFREWMATKKGQFFCVD